MRRIKSNPELLILNPDVDDPKTAWRELRKRYDIQEAVEAFEEMYPEHSVKRNKESYSVEDFPLNDDPDYMEALELFREFHGKDPDEITLVDIPEMGGDEDDVEYFVILGEAVAESYSTDDVIPGSSKEGTIYVHPYEKPFGRKPKKAVDKTGRLIITVPDGHIVKDWIFG